MPDSEKQTDDGVEHVSHLETTSPTPDQTLWQSIKKWPRVVIYCLALNTAILLYGYDLVIVGTVSAMPAFQCVSPSSNTPPISR